MTTLKPGDKVRSLVNRPERQHDSDKRNRTKGHIYQITRVRNNRIWYVGDRDFEVWADDPETFEVVKEESETSATSSYLCTCDSPTTKPGSYGFGGRIISYQICIACKKEYIG
jgi:hypothetical protein